jgi:hypothetical protein
MDPQSKPPAQQQHSSLSFGSKSQAPSGPDPEILSQVSNVTRRVRIIEESLGNLRKKTGIDEENNLAEIKKIHTSVKSLFAQIDELKKEQEDFKSQMRKMISEFQTVAKKDEVEVLKRYIKIWEPVQFATVNQVSHMIQDGLSQNTHGLPRKKPLAQEVEEVDQDKLPKETTQTKGEESKTHNFHRENFTKTDEIFAPNHNPNIKQYINEKEEVAEIVNTPAEPQIDITAENASAKPEVPLERKQKIAKVIEDYDDVRELILNSPHEFIKQIETEPELSKLFSGVDILSLSQKLKGNM